MGLLSGRERAGGCYADISNRATSTPTLVYVAAPPPPPPPPFLASASVIYIVILGKRVIQKNGIIGNFTCLPADQNSGNSPRNQTLRQFRVEGGWSGGCSGIPEAQAQLGETRYRDPNVRRRPGIVVMRMGLFSPLKGSTSWLHHE